MINGYQLERWDGSTRLAEGENGWENLLSHADIVEPGLVRAFGAFNNGSLVRIELSPEDTFRFARRTRLLQTPEALEFIGTRTIFGRSSPNGLGYFYVLYPNGGLKVTPDFNRG